MDRKGITKQKRERFRIRAIAKIRASRERSFRPKHAELDIIFREKGQEIRDYTVYLSDLETDIESEKERVSKAGYKYEETRKADVSEVGRKLDFIKSFFRAEHNGYEPKARQENELTDELNAFVQDTKPLPSGENNDSLNYDLSMAFDPLPLSSFARIFPIKNKEACDASDTHSEDVKIAAEKYSLKKWKYYNSKVLKNGLKIARVRNGSGRRESTFDPWLVGEWLKLINDAPYAPDWIDRRLMKILPERSKHFKDVV